MAPRQLGKLNRADPILALLCLSRSPTHVLPNVTFLIHKCSRKPAKKRVFKRGFKRAVSPWPHYNQSIYSVAPIITSPLFLPLYPQ